MRTVLSQQICVEKPKSIVLKKQRECNVLGTVATGGPESPLQPPSGKQSQFSIPFLGIANAFSGPHLHCTWSLFKQNKKRRKPKVPWNFSFFLEGDFAFRFPIGLVLASFSEGLAFDVRLRGRPYDLHESIHVHMNRRPF